MHPSVLKPFFGHYGRTTSFLARNVKTFNNIIIGRFSIPGEQLASTSGKCEISIHYKRKGPCVWWNTPGNYSINQPKINGKRLYNAFFLYDKRIEEIDRRFSPVKESTIIHVALFFHIQRCLLASQKQNQSLRCHECRILEGRKHGKMCGVQHTRVVVLLDLFQAPFSSTLFILGTAALVKFQVVLCFLVLLLL